MPFWRSFCVTANFRGQVFSGFYKSQHNEHIFCRPYVQRISAGSVLRLSRVKDRRRTARFAADAIAATSFRSELQRTWKNKTIQLIHCASTETSYIVDRDDGRGWNCRHVCCCGRRRPDRPATSLLSCLNTPLWMGGDRCALMALMSSILCVTDDGNRCRSATGIQ